MKAIWNVIKFTCTVYVIGMLTSIILISVLRSADVEPLATGVITGAVVSCLIALLLFVDLFLIDEV